MNVGAGGGGVSAFGGGGVDVGGTLNVQTGITVDGAALASTVPLAATAITQTYSTAAATVPNATYAAPTVTGVATTTVTKTNSSPYGFSSGDADAVVTFLGAAPAAILSLNTQLVALAADVLALKKIINQIVDDLQVAGIET